MTSSPRSLLVTHQLRREHAALLHRIEALEDARHDTEPTTTTSPSLDTKMADTRFRRLDPQLDALVQQQSELRDQIEAMKRSSITVENDLRDRLGELEATRSRQQLYQMSVDGELYREALAVYQRTIEELTAVLRGDHEEKQHIDLRDNSLSRQVKAIADNVQLQNTVSNTHGLSQKSLSFVHDATKSQRASNDQAPSSDHETPESPDERNATSNAQKTGVSVLAALRESMRKPAKGGAVRRASRLGMTHSSLSIRPSPSPSIGPVAQIVADGMHLAIATLTQGSPNGRPVARNSTSSLTASPSAAKASSVSNSVSKKRKLDSMQAEIEQQLQPMLQQRSPKHKKTQQRKPAKDQARKQKRTEQGTETRITRSRHNKLVNKLLSPPNNPEMILNKRKKAAKQMVRKRAKADNRKRSSEAQQRVDNKVREESDSEAYRLEDQTPASIAQERNDHIDRPEPKTLQPVMGAVGALHPWLAAFKASIGLRKSDSTI